LNPQSRNRHQLASGFSGIPVKHASTGIFAIKAGVSLPPSLGSAGIRSVEFRDGCRQGSAKDLVKAGQPFKSLGLTGTGPGIFKLASAGMGDQKSQSPCPDNSTGYSQVAVTHDSAT
jgi:hypothetical protein